jgi:pseudouridine synthase
MGLPSLRRLAFLLFLGVGTTDVRAFSAESSPLNLPPTPPNLRLNKVFRATHSRRKADTLIADGRVAVNGVAVEDMGRRVTPFVDQVSLDGQIYAGWERRHGFTLDADASNEDASASSLDTTALPPIQEEYIKFWKPVGVTSTTDPDVPGNLLEALEDNIHNSNEPPIVHRIFSVGRLDKDSSGLLLMTSDGRLPSAVLRKEFKQPKRYEVVVDRPIHPDDLEDLRRGIVITTDKVRAGKHTSFTARTLPCDVSQGGMDAQSFAMTLTEGRNRQIRVMLQTLGYRVLHLHRSAFLGLDLSGLDGPGDWMRLSANEQRMLEDAMARAEQPRAED